MISMLRLLSFGLVALAAFPAAAQDADSLLDDRDPLLFVMEDDDSRVYLFGSIHVLDAASYPLPADVEAAYADAEAVAFEIDLRRKRALERVILRRSMYRDGRTLRDVLGVHYAKLDKLVERAGYPSGFFDDFKPWAVQFSLDALDTDDSPYTSEDGVDLHFTTRAQTDGKEILALETPDEQIDAMDLLPEKAQVEWLLHSLDQWFVQDAVFEALVTAWRAGDETRLAAMMNQMPKRPRLAILRDRNAAWVPKIEAYLAREDDVMVVVGAGHLAGDDSVVAMLRAKGYTLTRQ